MQSFTGSRSKPPILLELDLRHPLIEQEPEDPLAKLRSRGKPRLRSVLRTLHEAGSDDRVAGLIARVGDTTISLARAQELRDAVGIFAASGKPTVAWAESFGESQNATVPYMLATAFGEIWLQPTGELNLLGLAAEVTFLRGALDKLGVTPLMGQRYEYKSAADRLLTKEFTDAHREAADRLAESAWEQCVDAIAKSRNLTPEQVVAATSRSPLFAEEAQQLGLVDRVGYRDEAYAASRRSAGGDVRLLFADRWSRKQSPVVRVAKQVTGRNAPGLALIQGQGAIVTGKSRRLPMRGPAMGSDTITAAFRAAVRDDKVRAIVFRVDSPGGSSIASDSICREVERARDADKPVIVSMGSVAGSGGYYVSCTADVIVAEPGTLTGSIGVLGGKFLTADLTDKLGLSYGELPHGEHALMYSTHKPFGKTEQARMDAWLDRVYEDFTGKVATGRSMTREAVHEVAKGRVWTGADAASRGLVDELGGLRDAVAVARARVGLPDDAPIRTAGAVPPLARLRPPRSSEDPRATAALTVTELFESGWGTFAAIATQLGLPAAGPLTMLPIRLV